MASDGQIVFEVTADGKHAIADIKAITKAIQQETGKWDNAAKDSADNIDNSFSGVLKKLAAGFGAAKIGKALLQIGKDAVQAASDLQEVQNVVDVTFGSNANKVEQWAKDAGAQFGLTETQAKKFSSTMGAMLKSSGLAGDEIVNVSTDLAGLAADMASFYNLDFDEAFSKIRSGMSGMTMPLKELGIDMSVDTMNAFALQQGLNKTFSQMSQGEQTILRYQYLMQATADAQGDFARTSDGYANGIRQLETNLTTLKTGIGEQILPFINDLVQGINTLFPETPRNDSILNQLAEIQIKKDEKIAEINAIKDVADELVLTLEQVGQDGNAGAQLEKLATGANTLDSSSVGNWQSILSSLKGIDGLDKLFGEGGNAVGTVEDLASALAGQSVTTNKAQAWQTFLSALGDNADAVSKLTGTTAEETKKWLEGMAQAAGELDPNDAAAWDTLMSSLVGGVGLNTDEGKKFVETLAQNFLALGTDSEDAVNGLKALGFSTDDIEQKQATWLRTCKELVSTIPGLSSIIDTNTGEVKGGIPAIKAYADEWERTAKYQAEIDALRSAKDIYNQNNNQAELNANATAKRAVAYAKMMTTGIFGFTEDATRSMLTNVGDAMTTLVNAGEVSWDKIKQKMFTSDTFDTNYFEQFGLDRTQYEWILSLPKEAKEAVLEYAKAQYEASLIEKERPEVLAEIEREEERLAEESGKTAEEIDAEAQAAEEAAKAMTTLEKAAAGDADAMDEVTTAVANANDALKEMADYAEGVRDKVASAIDSTTKGFEFIGDASQRQAKRLEPLEKELANLDKKSKNYKQELADIELRTSNAKDMYGVGNLTKNLESQLKFLKEYKADMEAARAKGFSDEFLAQFADGSVESAEWLHELANASNTEKDELNALYADVQKGKQELTDTLTQQQLSVDDTYTTLAAKAKEAVAALDMQGEAAENTGKTIIGIADGIKSHVPDVAEQVDAIIAELNRLDGFGINIDFGGFGSIDFTTSTGKKADSSGRFGLDYVPRDDYLIRAHEGERLLTAQENQIWNTLMNGGVSGVDLDALGGVMRDNVKPGGNVYLDGKVVGSVVSDRQGRNYKSLQRSGWQT